MDTQLSKITEQTMSSLEIAKLTGKTPGNVNRDIKVMLEQLGYSYLNSDTIQGVTFILNDQKQTKEILLDKDHALTLITGYDAKMRMAVNKRWQELEEKQANNNLTSLNDPASLRGLLLGYTERVIALEEKVKADEPKVIFAEKVRALDGSISVGDFAKLIGYGQNRLFNKMILDGFLMINNHPKQTAIDRGLLVQVESTPYTDSKGKSHPALQTRITGKGQVYFEKRYRLSA